MSATYEAPIPGQLAFDAGDDPGEDTSMEAVVAPAPHTAERPPQIRAVTMRNFKGYEDCIVSLAGFNVLVGPNNAGKSTLLQAIDLVFTLLKVHVDASGERLSTGKLVAPGILPVATPTDLWFQRRIRSGSQNVYCEVGIEFMDSSRVRFGLRHLYGGTNSKLLEQDGMEGPRLQALLARPANWVPSATGIVRDEEYRTPARRAALINAGRHNEIVRNLLVELREDRPEEFVFLQALLTERFNASVENVTFNGNTDQFVSTEFTAGDTHHDIYSAGAGFVQIVQMLAFILARDAGVVLLDEPDAHLHSSLQRTISDLLRSLSSQRGFQVIVATHSKEIINSVDPTNLVVIEKGATRAEVGSAGVTPMTVMESLGDIDNVDAYALLRNRRCLFVEGKKDDEIFGRFAATRGLAAFAGDDRVVTIAVGGADRFEHLSQLDVIEGLLGTSVSSLEIRDRDGRRAELREAQIADSVRPLHILNRDCIESYLVSPMILARCVKDLLEQRGETDAPDESTMRALVDEVCGEMRSEAADRLVTRWQTDTYELERKALNVTELGPEARSLVDSSWSELDERLTVLPGKKLLSRIKALVQSRYGVSFGNHRLAEMFGAEEIPAELRDLLDRTAALTAPAPDAA